MITMLDGLVGLTATVFAKGLDSDQLEPCINGQVFVAVLHATQAEEDAALPEVLRREPGATGKVAARGR